MLRIQRDKTCICSKLRVSTVGQQARLLERAFSPTTRTTADIQAPYPTLWRKILFLGKTCHRYLCSTSASLHLLEWRISHLLEWGNRFRTGRCAHTLCREGHNTFQCDFTRFHATACMEDMYKTRRRKLFQIIWTDAKVSVCMNACARVLVCVCVYACARPRLMAL